MQPSSDISQDEYIGIPREHPESYHTFMYKHFFSHVNVHPKNIHILNGNAPDPEAECVQYEAAIKAAGGIDLFLGGIGPDGHIAFNEPGSSLASRTRVKTLAYDTIIANSRFFGNDLDKVPKMALTVGVQTILEAREVVIIITGAHKALALQKCIEGGVNHMWTLSSLQLHPHPMIVVDEDATLELQVKTVKVYSPLSHYPLLDPLLETQTNDASKQYFKSIEKVAASQGFEQILPSTVRTGPKPLAAKRIELAPEVKEEPSIFAPQPLTSQLLSAPATEYPLRSHSPDLVLDRMGSRVAAY
jgi:glucosamine-6-phosphate deaminase